MARVEGFEAGFAEGHPKSSGRILLRPLVPEQMAVDFCQHATSVLSVEPAPDGRGLLLEVADPLILILEESVQRRRLGDVVPVLSLV